MTRKKPASLASHAAGDGQKTGSWCVVTCDSRKEAKVYGALVEWGFDCWLPSEPRSSRIPHSKAVRQWWAPVLPGMFFAIIPQWAIAVLASMRDRAGVLRDANDAIVTVPDAAINKFRREIEEQNRAELILRRIGDARARGVAAKAVHRKPKKSRRLKASERLRGFVAAAGAGGVDKAA